ncbi:MAG: PilC/PilY family type IV pilus protein [Pseudomonadota bacterium]
MAKHTVSKAVSLLWSAGLALVMTSVSPAAWAAEDEVEANLDSFDGVEDQPISGNVLTNDTWDEDNPVPAPRELTIVSQPANGNVSIDSTGTISYVPNPDFSGVDIARYRVRWVNPFCSFFGWVCEDIGQVNFVVFADADEPIVSASGVTGEEDDDIPLSLSAELRDKDGSESLELRLSGVPSGATLNAGTEISPGVWAFDESAMGSLAIKPPPNVSGVITLTFGAIVTDVAVDEGGDFLNEDSANAGAVFSVNVIAVDDPPTQVGPTPDIFMSEDTPLSFNLAGLFGDPDSPLTLAVTGVSHAALESVNLVGQTLNLVPIENENGSGSVTVTAEHPTNPVSVTIPIEVDPVNDAPVVDQPIDDVTVDEDSGDITVSLASAFADVDIATNGDALAYTISALTGAAVFDDANVAGTSLVFSLQEHANGIAQVEVTAKDQGGALISQLFSIDVQPVNDAPFVDEPIPDQFLNEDDAELAFNLEDVFDDVDILTNGDVLSFSVDSVSDPTLFDDIYVDAGNVLRVELAPDANGTATVSVKADDGDLEAVDTFIVDVNPVNDVPEAFDDVVVMDEDDGVLVIDVLANDYLAEDPAIVVSAGTGGFSDSPTAFSYLDATGDPVEGPTGEVVVAGGVIEYRPRANFFGTDTFTYQIQDENGGGDLSNFATVTVTVNSVNDPPTSEAVKTYYMFSNGTIDVASEEGVARDSYDVDYALIDPDTGDTLGGAFSAALETLPDVGGSFSFATDGSFSYSPPADFTGVATFTYRVQDDQSSSAGVYQARIVVQEPPEPAAAPAAGEVAVPFGLASTPLEQATGVTPNVLVMMDDSGSMDWDITTLGSGNDGVMRLSNAAARDSGQDRTNYRYLWTLVGNSYSETDNSGRSLPTEEALDANADTDNNQYGVWRGRNHQFNVMYYNPEIRYEPWVGYDASNVLFGPANPSAIRLNPVDSTQTMDILTDFTYNADNVPQWDADGGTVDLPVTVYIPRYYTTTVDGVPAWNDPHTLIEIRDGAGPLAGGLFPGGSNRFDCAGDGDPDTCTYAEEIQNFANWFQYYRKREFVAKASVAAVLEDVDDLRVGFETLNRRDDFEIAQMNALISEGNKKDILDTVFDVNSTGGTPLRRALQDAGDIYSCTRDGRDCPILPAPDGTCQQNFALLFSDGYWNGAAGVANNQDDDGPGPWDGGRYADTRADTLADTAMFYYENDIQPTMADNVAPTAKDKNGRVIGEFDPNERMHQHMKTFTIAFGILGTIDPDTVPTDPTEAFTWTDPTSNQEHKIDDMLHAAVNGRGEFLSASDPNRLRRVVEDAFEEFSNAQSSVSAAAFNSTSLRDGTFLFRGSYDLSDNTGELTATEVSVDGVVAATPLWSAADNLESTVILPENRRIVSYDRGAQDGIAFRFDQLSPEQQLVLNDLQLDWLRGERAQEIEQDGVFRDRRPDKILGDIVNSSPVFVAQPRAINRDQAPYPTASGELYSEFKAANDSREGIVYVGANDGMLHGFNAETGEERIAYVPNKLMDSSQRFAEELRELTDPFYSHRYYVDLTPRLNDAYISPTGSGTKDWRTILIGGLGGGGKGYYALDVTNPNDYNSDGAAEDIVLWEFTDEDDSYPVDEDGNPLGGAVGAVTDPDGLPVKDLGYSYSLPTVAMSNVEDADGENEWIAIFGNGQNSTSGIAKLYALFIDEGIDGWDADDYVKIDTGYGVPVTEPAEWVGYPNGLGSPTAVDTDLNGTVDLVYAGDVFGNLFRFDLRSDDPDDWKAVLLFTATYTESGVDRRQAALQRPLVTPHPTKPGFLVIFGTGSYFTDEDASSDDIQSIYGIWDPVASDSPFTAAANSKATRLVEQTITNVVDDSVTPPQTRRIVSQTDVNYTTETTAPGVYGWYIDLDMPRATTTLSGATNTDSTGNAPPAAQFPGERAIRRFVLRNGNVITTTVLPTTGEASCFGTRPGAILIFNAANGGNATSPVIDFNRDGVVDDSDLVEVAGSTYAGGLLLDQDELDGSLVDLSTLGGDGDTDFLFVSGGNDTTSFRIEELTDDRTGRLSWREIQQD